MRVVLVVLIALTFAWPAAAERRVAFVVGNAAYENTAPLANPTNDSRLIAETLEGIGFEVARHEDLSRDALARALSAFLSETEGADVTFFYFAGHGVQLDGENYLLGTDATLRSEFDVISEGLALSDISDILRRRSKAALIFIDACRDNPLADAFYARNFPQSRSVATRGLAPASSTSAGTMLVFAASPGQVAYDGTGPNSPFSLALARHLPTPGVEVLSLMKRVIGDVRGLTRGLQNPTVTNDLAREIYLGPDLPQPALPDAAPDGPRLAAAAPPAPLSSPLITACDALAADPADPELPEGTPGIADGEIDAVLAIQACRIAVAGHPDHARSAYQLGRALSAQGNAEAAIPELRRAAALDHPRAQSQLGSVLLQSPDTAIAQEGATLLEKAAEQGDIAAARQLAAFYGDPLSRVPGGQAKATLYYAMTAEAGDVEAMFKLGYRLLSGTLSSETDRQNGLAWLERAAEEGSTEAQVRLATTYGLSGEFRDPRRSVFWFEQAALSGDTFSQRRLFDLYRGTNDVPANPERAALWARTLADGGNFGFATLTGYNYETGRGVARSPERAADYYFEALQQGDARVLRRAQGDWPRDTAIELQERLNASFDALYRGAYDGIVGPGTRAAMQRLCNCSGGDPVRFPDLFE